MRVTRGYIKEGTIPKVIAEIIRNRFTGVLHTEREKVKKEFFFIDGELVSSRSNLLNETLGRIALSQGILKNEIYQKALTLMKNRSMKFGEAVASLGWKLDIDQLLLMQLRWRFFDILTWKNGTYFLLDKKLESDKIQPFIKNVDTLKLLAEGIMTRMNVEAIGYKNDELLDSFYKEGERIERIKLLPAVKEILKDTARGWDIVKAIKKPERESLLMFYFYLITGVIKKVEPSRVERITETEQQEPTIRIPAEEKALYEKLSEKYDELKVRNYFEILGVDRNAEISEIRTAYYKLAREYHPDKYFNKSEAVRDIIDRIFTLINEAFSTLSDENRRKGYELTLEGKTISKEEGSQILEAEIQFKKAEILDRAGKLKECIELYRWASKLNPEESEYKAKLGWALYRLGKKTGTQDTAEEGKFLIMKAYEENPESAEITYIVASYYRAEGNKNKVIEYLKKTLSLDPLHESAKRELKFFRSKNG